MDTRAEYWRQSCQPIAGGLNGPCAGGVLDDFFFTAFAGEGVADGINNGVSAFCGLF
jgi:hypothetical protein